jgi:hypothetical protein
MSLLRILRNLAVLVILTAGGFSLIPRPVAAQSTCEPLGAYCAVPYRSQCCGGLCGWRHTCCDKPYYFSYCTTSAECCSGSCFNHRCG